MKKPKTPYLDTNYHDVITNESDIITDIEFEINRAKDRIAALEYCKHVVQQPKGKTLDQKMWVHTKLWNETCAITSFKYKR